MNNSGIVFLVVIGNRKQKENLIAELCKAEAAFFNVVYGKGLVKKNELLEAFGLVDEQNKVVITCLIKEEKSEYALKMLTDKFKFNQPNTGIAFTIPVDKLKY